MEKKYTEFPINSLRICINEEEPALSGIICGVYLKEDISYVGEKELYFKIDQAFDEIGRPQPNYVIRSFDEKKDNYTSYVGQPTRHHSAEEIHKKIGRLKTYDLIMTSRHHAEWQGLIKDTSGNILGRFRSSLECMRLL